MSGMKIAIVNRGNHPLPQYATTGAAAFDLAASLEAPVTLGSLERALIPTGIAMAIPAGHEAQIRPRSGLAAKHGVTILNAPGTIDSDYRGEWKVVMVNLSREPYVIHDGDRIAQVVIARCERAQWQAVTELAGTGRGDGGFGHTGR